VPGGGELKLEHVRPAYAVLDAFRHAGVDGHPSVTAIVAESKQLQEWQDLFELYVQVRGPPPAAAAAAGLAKRGCWGTDVGGSASGVKAWLLLHVTCQTHVGHASWPQIATLREPTPQTLRTTCP
jgi:hypothetical protein